MGVSKVSPSQLPKAGGWRLITRQHMNDADRPTSIMRVSDSSRSDENLVGIMLHCKTPNTSELHIAVVTPYSPRANLSVSLHIGAKLSIFPAKVGAGGSMVVLPEEAVEVLTGYASPGAELKVEIVSSVAKMVGTIPLDGLDAAYAAMMSACKVAR